MKIYNEYIIILDYTDGSVFYKKLTDFDNQLIEKGIDKFFQYYNLDEEDCAWTFLAEEPKLISLV